jgi:hypothetical protein
MAWLFSWKHAIVIFLPSISRFVWYHHLSLIYEICLVVVQHTCVLFQGLAWLIVSVVVLLLCLDPFTRPPVETKFSQEQSTTISKQKVVW